MTLKKTLFYLVTGEYSYFLCSFCFYRASALHSGSTQEMGSRFNGRAISGFGMTLI